MQQLDDKVIVVTGGGDGIGRACSIEFAAQGATVVIGDLSGDKATDVAQQAGDEAIGVACDVRREQDVAALMQRAVTEHGRIDALFACAGIEGNGTAVETDVDDFDNVMAVNVRGVFLASKHALPHIIAAGGGSILAMASVSAWWGEPYTVAYNASKGAIVGMVRAMAMDHGRHNVRVNAICPSMHETGMVERYFADVPDADGAALRTTVENLAALRRMGRPEELAKLAAFILSDANQFMTGALLVNDGGTTAGYPYYD